MVFFLLQYNFEGRYDLVHFIKTVQKVGLYVHLRIGPYVCAEWNFGYVTFNVWFLSVYVFLFLSLFFVIYNDVFFWFGVEVFLFG
jgi:hypothetical protein